MEFRRIEFGRRTNRQFNYTPRYYDETMEDLHERADRARRIRDAEKGDDTHKERIKHAFRARQVPERQGVNQALWISRLRVVVIAVILGLMFYLFFFTDVISTIFEAFSNA